jgi:hypothetical protein
MIVPVRKKVSAIAILAGTHDIELRNSEGRTLFEQGIGVIAGKTTEVEIDHLRG